MAAALRILYVDDEPSLQEAIKLYLESEGEFAVDTFTSANEAIIRINTERYDAIISDYQMPGMDGIEFLKTVRSSGNTIPFILFTGKGREEVVITALNEGADFYLQKGGKPEALFAELVHKIQQAVQHRRADVRIRDYERREADIINFLPDATFAIDTNGVVIAWNHAMEEMCGIKASEILGKGNYEYSIPLYKERRPILVDLILHDEPAIAAKYPSLKREGQTLIAEATSPYLYNGRGATIWFIAAPLCNNQGEVVGAIESIRDITERKRAEDALLKNTEELHASYEEITATEEELRANLDQLTRQELELRESREKYRSLFSDSRDGIVMVDGQGRFLDANPVYCAMLGYSVEELRTISFPRITPEKWQAWEGEEIWNRRLMKDGYTGIYEKEYIRKDGLVFPVELQAFTVFDTNRNIKYVWGTVRDITERKQQELALLKNTEELHASYEEITATEEELRANLDQMTRQELELRESEEKLAAIVAGSPVPKFVIDSDHRIMYWNRALEQTTGISAAQVIGTREQWRAFYPDERPTMADLILDGAFIRISELFAGKSSESPVVTGAFEATDFFPHMGERGTYLRFMAAPIKNVHGVTLGAVETLIDVSEIKRAEGELRTKNDELHASYEELTATEEELRGQVDMLAENERTIRESEERVRKKLESLLSPEGDIGTLDLADIIDVQAIQSLMEDFHSIMHIASAIIDIHGNVLVATGWQDICTQFHRVNPETCANCVESDNILSGGIAPGTFKIYRCKNNMWDIATPITVSGKHMGNLFLGQFLFDDESVDYELFRSQAVRYGFDEQSYLAALDRVPRWNRETVDTVMAFYTKFARMVSTLSHSNITLARTVTERDTTLNSLLKVNQKLNVLSQLTRQDLTTQIFIVNSFLEMVKKQAKGQDGIIKNIESGERAVRSIKEITEFTKDYHNMGEKPPKWQNVKLSFLFGLSHISIGEIRHSLETENLEIFADPLLEKAFQGLLENSVKHGGHVSEIRVSHTVTPDWVTVVFEDNGVGISAEKKERIFLRGEGARASVRGLFFVQEILSITGIIIRENGEPGKGARFEMTVPKGAWRIGGR